MFSRIYIFLNGEFKKPKGFPEKPEPGSLVIAADGGLRHVKLLSWKPDVITGDFDSVTSELLSEYEGDETISIFSYPSEKDQTDFEIAFELALSRLRPQGGTLEILGAFGGRWDMTFSNLLVPAAMTQARTKSSPALSSSSLSSPSASPSSSQSPPKNPVCLFKDGESLIYVLFGPQRLALPQERIGETLSLIPLSPVVREVSLIGDFQYPLNKGDLRFGLTIGLSNKIKGSEGEVVLKEGVLAVFLEN
jgi:thiamine pyrophosphokinase